MSGIGMHAPTPPFRTYSADEMLQIIDFLVAMGELSDADATGMTRLALILKRFETGAPDDIAVGLLQCYRDIKNMELPGAQLEASSGQIASIHRLRRTAGDKDS